MSDINDIDRASDTPSERPPVGTLVDFVTGVDEGNPLDIEVSINQAGRVLVFHDKPFKMPVSWFEYNLSTSMLNFVMDNGEVRDSGLPLAPVIAKYMHNTHQILTILLDDGTGEAIEGHYIPLIIHQE